MNVPRDVVLLLVAVLTLFGGAATVARLLRARRHGLSIRLQMFLATASTVALLNAAFAAIVIDRFQARAALFARRAAEDQARAAAEVVAASRGGQGLGRALQGFAQAAHVRVLDASGAMVFEAGSAPPPTAVASVPVAGGGSVRLELPTFGMVQVMSDVAPKVALLAVLLAAAAALAATVIGRAVGRPIERLTRAAEHVAAGERQGALPVPQGREVRALTEALDQMRRELEQRHALEAFVADLSHELKNPIASIRASAEVLEEAIAADPDAARRFARRIQDSGAKLSSLVADLLALAKLEAHGLAERAQAVDLAELARAAAEAHAAQAAARGVRVDVSAPEHAPVRGDATWLRRAIENLLANAVAFSRGPVELGVAASPRGWEVTVKDAGPGVAEVIRPRLFERFATTRGAEGGTGLGLAIVRAVAEAHGGSAGLRTTGPEGSTFVLFLPERRAG